MQTMYYQTKNFIRHEGNVVNLQDYRTRLRACSGFDALPIDEDSTESEAVWAVPEEAPVSRPAVRETQAEAAKPRRTVSLHSLPDLCATVAILVMAVTVIVRFLQF